MVFFNYATMQMAAKIVYYGPGLCGKTTNLHHIYARTSPQSRGEMVSLETETDRTLFFDLLPIDVGVIGGFKTRLQLYTVPGQVFYNTTRKLVLKGVDGIVFVADSQKAMMEANIESLRNLRENLAEIGVDIDEIPLVVQLNKRDLPNIASVEAMVEALDPQKRLEHVESIASAGTGVFETLKVISKLTLRTLRRRMTGDEPSRTVPPARAAQFRVQEHAAPGRTHAAARAASAAADAVAATARAGMPQPVEVPEPLHVAEELAAASETFPPETTIAAATLDAEQEQRITTESEPFVTDTTLAAADLDPHLLAGAPAPVADSAAAVEASFSDVSGSEPEIEFTESSKPAAVEPKLKTVKVRSSVDVMAELEALRKRATQTTPRTPKRDVLADLQNLRPRRDVHRTVNLSVPADIVPRTRSVRVTLAFEDEQGVLETREEQIELGDTSDVQSVSVNLKIDLA